jgi:hypothetical protein
MNHDRLDLRQLAETLQRARRNRRIHDPALETVSAPLENPLQITCRVACPEMDDRRWRAHISHDQLLKLPHITGSGTHVAVAHSACSLCGPTPDSEDRTVEQIGRGGMVPHAVPTRKHDRVDLEAERLRSNRTNLEHRRTHRVMSKRREVPGSRGIVGRSARHPDAHGEPMWEPMIGFGEAIGFRGQTSKILNSTSRPPSNGHSSDWPALKPSKAAPTWEPTPAVSAVDAEP